MKKLFFGNLFLFLYIGCVHAQWQQTYCPAGYIKCLLPNDSNVYAGTESGFFHSGNNDTNTSWTVSNTGLPNYNVQALAKLANTLFAGIWGPVGGVFHSNTNGNSWVPDNNGLPSSPYFYVNTFISDSTNLFTGSNYGVFLTRDTGKTWKSVNTGIPQGGVQVMTAIGSYLFSGTANGVYLSINNGTSWALTGLDSIRINALVISGVNLFAGTDQNGIYLSPDSGKSWTAENNGLPTNFPISSFSVSGSRLFAGTNGAGVFLTTTNGTNWLPVNMGLTGTALNISALAISGINLFAGTLGSGLFVAAFDTLTGIIDKHPANLQVSIYPNPGHDRISITSAAIGKQFLQIIDLNGEIGVSVKSWGVKSKKIILPQKNYRNYRPQFTSSVIPI